MTTSEDSVENVWNLSVTNYEEYEYHELSREELQEILREEWNRSFNGLFVGRDVDCVGRIGAFFYQDQAYVAYEDFEKQALCCSYDPTVRERSDWDSYVRLTPGNTHDFSFRRCSIITKASAMQIIENYLQSNKLDKLYFLDSDGRPEK